MAPTTPDGNMLFHVSAIEMSDHLKARVDYHVKRNEEMNTEAENLNEKLEEELSDLSSVADRMQFKASNSYAGNASRRDQLKVAARVHATKATVLKFYHDHLPAESGYLLSSQELVALEFIPSAF